MVVVSLWGHLGGDHSGIPFLLWGVISRFMFLKIIPIQSLCELKHERSLMGVGGGWEWTLLIDFKSHFR